LKAFARKETKKRTASDQGGKPLKVEKKNPGASPRIRLEGNLVSGRESTNTATRSWMGDLKKGKDDRLKPRKKHGEARLLSPYSLEGKGKGSAQGTLGRRKL